MRIPLKIEWIGLMLSLLLGGMAVYGGPSVLGINAVMAGLLAGMIGGNVFKFPKMLMPGISFSATALLELSIVFLGFEISFDQISELGGRTFAGLAMIIVLVIIFSIWLSRKMKCPGSTGLLVGFGTAICGSSAIAAAAPRISENKTDAGIAMAVVNLLGASGMLMLPLMLKALDWQEIEQGFLIGSTLHAVGNVAGAGFSLSDDAGSYALTVKLARVALLTPALIFFGLLLNRKQGSKWSEQFKLPLYLWLFILITLSTLLIDYPHGFTSGMKWTGKWLLSSAMFAIGTKLSLRKLYSEGKAAMGFGVLIFLFQLFLSAFVLWLFRWYS